MLGIIVISALNILLNVIDLVFHVGWGYSWLSLAVAFVFIALATIIRRIAAWCLKQLRLPSSAH